MEAKQTAGSDSDYPAPPNPPHSSQRRPRRFASTSASSPPPPTSRKEREKEKERTKLRERNRRAITSRMLSGLRQHGNFSLPARADMNDVLAALAREVGWVVEADGTTYRPATHGPTLPGPPPISTPSQLVNFAVRTTESPISSSSLKSCEVVKANLDVRTPLMPVEDGLSPASLDSAVAVEDAKRMKHGNACRPMDSLDCVGEDQISGLHEDDFVGTQYVPVFATLPMGIINNYCELVNPEALKQELRHLKELKLDGVVVYCWWGIVEGWAPRKYDWSGYIDLFTILKEFHLKFQVVLAFHEYGGFGVNGSDRMPISLPKWVLEIGKENPDIFFTDCEGRRNTECLSWGIDRERALNGRTGLEVCFDFMRTFRAEFDALFEEGTITAVEIGMGASGELRYPSFPQKLGWRYPGIGEFQCYDRYMQQDLRHAAKLRGHAIWGRGPDNAGYYNSRPNETGFFCDKGDYDNYYGRFFLRWYAGYLINHTDQILTLTRLAFDGIQVVIKIPLLNWWYKSACHAAELTAGFNNPANRDGYTPVLEVLKRHDMTVKLVFCGSHSQDDSEACADTDGLCWQVMSSARDIGLIIAAESSFPCHDRDMYGRIVNMAKSKSDPDHRHLLFFTYQRPDPMFMQQMDELHLTELDHFIRCMHGEATTDVLA